MSLGTIVCIPLIILRSSFNPGTKITKLAMASVKKL